MREGPRGSNGARSTLHLLSVFHSATHNQIGPLWCWFPNGWTCARSGPLWVSPTTSPVRLGVSPAATPTPTGVFSQKFEALFPPRWNPGLHGLLRSPPFIPVYLCASVGPRGATRCSATRSSACPILRHPESRPLGLSVRECGAVGSASSQTACPVLPHSASLGPARAMRVLSTPAAHLCPSYQSGEMFLFLSTWCRTSLPFDFLSVLVVRGGTVCLPTPPSWFSL